jgi:hypothetical protein
MKHLTNEKAIIETDGNVLVLTSHRVRYNATAMSTSDFMSIMLEEVASCGIVKKTRPILLVIAFGFAILALYVWSKSSVNAIAGPMVMAGIFGLAYYLTIRKMLEIASAGSSILVNVSKMGMTQIIEFVDELEIAKNALQNSRS